MRLNLTIIFLVGLIFLYKPTKAQNTDAYLNNFVQPAPNAAALGKYADYPVSYYTGVPEIGIPLYTLVDGSIKLPISLSYHASGIRVSENASWVGLGWTLNAGGIIIRTVRGAPDEGTRKSSIAAGPIGYYYSQGLSTMPLLPSQAEFDNDQNSYLNFTSYFIPAVCEGAKDCEPDLYTFNFNGHTGKFVFDEKGVPRLLTDDNIRIRVVASGTSFQYWVITTADGVQYYFGENNAREVTYPHSDGGAYAEDGDATLPSSWYLTRIVDPSTNDTATFGYVGEGYSYRDIGPETTLYGTGLPGSNTDITKACDDGNIILYPNIITTGIYGLRLTSITTKNYHVNFIANNQRQDLIQSINYPANVVLSYPGSGAYSLDFIKVYGNGGNCFKQIAFGYSYFTSTTQTSAGMISKLSENYDNDVTDTKRLKLTTLTESDGTGTLQKPPYAFTYNETQQLPRRLNFDQDHWGFSNNAAGNNNVFFTPKVTAGYCTFVSSGANRTSKWPDMSAFTLTAIKDPLGVSTSFQYEANNPAPSSEPAQTVGGLRVVQIQTTDNVTGTVNTRKFDYSLGGIQYSNPQDYYLIQLRNEYYHTGTPPGNTGGYNEYSNNPSGIYNVLRSSQSIVPMQDPQGNFISYPNVKEIFGANGENGYKIHKYSVEQSPNSDASRIDIGKYTAIGIISGIAGYYGSGHFNDTLAYPAILPINLLPYYAPYTNTYLYPITPQQVDVTRGNLLGEYTYDATGNMLESIENTYDETLHENYWIRGFKAYRATNMTSSGNQYNMDALAYYKLHTGISHLLSTIKTSYNPTGNVVVTTNYSYDSPSHTLPTSETTTNSNGDVLINKTYYSFDYTNTATSDNVFSKMKSLNLLLPVHTQSWKNGNLVGGKITLFHDFATSGSGNTFINPVNIYALETAAALTPAQASESTTWTAPVSTLLPNSSYISKVNFTFDGSTNSLISQQLTNNKPQGMQWSTGLRLPVAVVDNASNTPALKEFYYEGFEESTASGLNYSAAHTGAKSISSPYTVSWTLPNSRSYVISYWYLSGTVWKLQPDQPFTGSLALAGGTAYDDIRIYPADAAMTSYTYNITGNLTSSIDPKGLTSYYEYDSFQRLVNIKDKDGNILKNYCYNYAGQQTGCPLMLYYNTVKSGAYTRNCGAGSTGTSVTYTVAAGTYTASTQAAADQLAQNDVTANGQTYANANGACTIICTGNAYKMINGSCQQGSKLYDTSTKNGSTYTCTYHYQWSDGSVSGEYSETNAFPCAIQP